MDFPNPLRSDTRPVLIPIFAVFLSSWFTVSGEEEDRDAQTEASQDRIETSLPASEAEALGRARWIHEAMHGVLQVMHRDFFGDGGEGLLSLPSQSLEDVFKEMARSWRVEIRWLGINATKDADHDPQDEFEKKAAVAIEAGAEEYGALDGGRYRFVGAIRLQNECLKCHVPNRTSLEDRVAGLAISIPIRARPEK